MKVLRRIAEKRRMDRMRNVKIREEVRKARSSAREDQKEPIETERCFGKDGSREASNESV